MRGARYTAFAAALLFGPAALSFGLAALLFGPAVYAGDAPRLGIEQIMADPDWIGAPVRDAYWSGDGRSAYYWLKRSGSPIVDLHRVDIGGRRDQVVDAPDMAGADGPTVYDVEGRRAAFVRNGDLFLRELGSGRLTQITRTPQVESSPQFSADGQLLSFRVGRDWWVYDVRGGVSAPAAVLMLEKDPDAAPKPDDLHDMQMRTYATLRRLHEEKEQLRRHADDLQKRDSTRSALPFYLGDEVSVVDTSLSPDAHWLLVVTEPKSAEAGFEGKFTRYVTESGYEEFGKERVRVGRNAPAPQSLLLLDLTAHTAHALPLDPLPGIEDDPLSAVRAENGGQDPHAGDVERPPRGVLVVSKDPDAGAGGFSWSRDGRAVAIEFRAIDNKDRWIASVDFDRQVLVPQHRLTDPAWIGWRFNEFGWLNDNRTLWYASEESGFGHLYTKSPGAVPRALTQGRFEISDAALSADGRWFFVLSNAEAPYAYDVYRVASSGGALQRVTRLEGVESFAVEHTGKRLLVTHSSSYMPAQLAVAQADGSGTARDLTETRTAEYRSLAWIAPEIVRVPSTHVDGVVYAKVYRASGDGGAYGAGTAVGSDGADGAGGAGGGGGSGGAGDARDARDAGGRGAQNSARRPAVVFVHGAGYTQNVHLRFPYYFREQMFNNLLAQKGYVVIDLDYRASSGYGRDWRTAIYRQMGHPELEDLLDVKQWLVEHEGVDPQRIGVYGGSYGGFMTLMALFRAPGEFAAGAALRPVTDWMQYEHDYTSDILNEPQTDPAAYARSSPIEYAAGLKDALLICHGVVDDNVLFEDSMRLYQRLIELHKDNFSISPYPLDSHGFINADSWIDEYKRIDRLFESTLRP